MKFLIKKYIRVQNDDKFQYGFDMHAQILCYLGPKNLTSRDTCLLQKFKETTFLSIIIKF